MRPRALDHLVIALNDLGAGRETFQRLGFTLTPVARHPFGTINSIVRFQGNFLELLGIGEPDVIVDGTDTEFSFAGFNRDYLSAGEGASMLALKTQDPDADIEAFAAGGLAHFKRFDFERQATDADGNEATLSFSLSFTAEPRLPRAGFFTCQLNRPDDLPQVPPEPHANGALAIESVVLVAPDPADYHEFLTFFTGQHDIHSTSLGVAFDLGDAELEVLTPVAFRAFYGETAGARLKGWAACRIAVVDLAETERFLTDAGIVATRMSGALVVSAAQTHGIVLAFVEGARPSD